MHPLLLAVRACQVREGVAVLKAAVPSLFLLDSFQFEVLRFPSSCKQLVLMDERAGATFPDDAVKSADEKVVEVGKG